MLDELRELYQEVILDGTCGGRSIRPTRRPGATRSAAISSSSISTSPKTG
jgi:hypothetical protein